MATTYAIKLWNGSSYLLPVTNANIVQYMDGSNPTSVQNALSTVINSVGGIVNHPSAKTGFTYITPNKIGLQGAHADGSNFTITSDGTAVVSGSVSGSSYTFTVKEGPFNVRRDNDGWSSADRFVTTTATNGTVKNSTWTRVTGVNSSSTDAQIPTAKAVYTAYNASMDAHKGSKINLTYTAGTGIGLDGVHAGDSKIKIDAGNWINITNSGTTLTVNAKGTSTAPSSSSTNDDIPTSAAVYSAITEYGAKALKYEGTIDGTNTIPTAAAKGSTYIINRTDLSVNGTDLEPGDMIIAYNGSGDSGGLKWSTANTNWTVNGLNSTLKWGKEETIANIGGNAIKVKQAPLNISSAGDGNVVSKVSLTKTDTAYTLNVTYGSITGNQPHQLVGTTTPSIKLQSNSAIGEVKFGSGTDGKIKISYASGGNLTFTHNGSITPTANSKNVAIGGTFVAYTIQTDSTGHVKTQEKVTYTITNPGSVSPSKISGQNHLSYFASTTTIDDWRLDTVTFATTEQHVANVNYTDVSAMKAV